MSVRVGPEAPSVVPALAPVAPLRALARDAAGYFAVSLLALGVDWGLLALLHRALGWHYLAAACASFMAGLAVAWSLSIRYVFRDRRRLSALAEFGGFLATGLAGLAVNQIAMAMLVGGADLAPEIAKGPVAGVVFVFNFISRRALFAPDGQGARAAPKLSLSRAAPGVIAGLAASAVFLLSRPSSGIVGDAKIYIGRALADLDPAGVGRDVMFALDGQSKFTVFGPLARALAAHLSPLAAADALVLAGQALWIPALLLVCAQASRARWAWIAALAAVVPAGYGANSLLMFGESIATPRPFAEAFVLFAFAAWLAGRRLAAAGLLLVATLFHPIMTLAGVAALGLILMAEDARWRSGALALAFAVLAAGALGLPVADRLFVAPDADWLALLRARNPYLFVDQWSADVFGFCAVQALTILIAAGRARGPMRAVLLAALAAGLGGLAAAALVSAWPNLLGLQLQLWRMWWLTGAMAAVAFGLIARGAGDDPQASVSAAVLTLAWALPAAGPAVTPLIALGALVLDRRRPGIARLDARASRLAWIGVAVLVLAVWLMALPDMARLFEGWPQGYRPRLAHMAFSVVQEPLIALLAAAAALDLARRMTLWVRAAGAGALAIAAAFVWNDSSTFDRALGDGRRQAALAEAARASEGDVLWLGASNEPWLWLGAPNWAGRIQGAGLVFSRDLAARYEARAKTLLDLRIDDFYALRFSERLPLLPRPAGGAFDALCARPDAPVSIVAPLERGLDAPADWRARTIWTAPAARVDPPRDAQSPLLWIDRYAVILCEDHRTR